MALTTVKNAGLAGSIDLTAKVTGTLPVANGGTALTSGFNNAETATTFTNITFDNSYSAQGTGNTRNIVWKMQNVVYVICHCSRSSTPDNNMVVGTLPSGYRPASTKYVASSIGYQADSTDVIYVESNGNIKVGSPSNSGDGAYYLRLSFFFPLTD